MRYRTKHYAKALFESLKTAGKKEQSATVSRFIQVLTKHRKLSLLKEISREFEKLADGTADAPEVVIQAATESDARRVARKIGGKNPVTVANPELIAGADIRIGDIRISGSLGSRLRELRKTVTQ